MINKHREHRRVSNQEGKDFFLGQVTSMKTALWSLSFVIAPFERDPYNLSNGLKKWGNVRFQGSRIMKIYIKMFTVVQFLYNSAWPG